MTHRPQPPSILDRLLTPTRKRFLKFGMVGSSGVVVNLTFVWIALQFTPSQEIGSAVGILVSVFTNFLLNDAWTWGDRTKRAGARSFLLRVAQYYLASGLAIAIQYGTAMTFVHAWEQNVYAGQLTGIGMGMVVNFIVNNFWTFREDRTQTGPDMKINDLRDAHPDD
jgi:dolichol-phosphate mannosyltransferase